ncbi:DUF488 family protein [Streptomyces sp. NPDC085944]|uniref:DUF488 domain-containing protein n=1 Tax=Streptomyces sp. NPDC085944 TaxID=3154962 RepID=UPI00341B0C4B
MSVRVRRVDEPPDPDDGVRALVDRLWPRGVARDAAHVDEWPKGLTPSSELRRRYHAGEGSYENFARRYEAEPAAPAAAELLDRVRRAAGGGRRAAGGGRGDVKLLTASKSPDRSHAAVLLRLLGRR